MFLVWYRFGASLSRRSPGGAFNLSTESSTFFEKPDFFETCFIPVTGLTASLYIVLLRNDEL